MSKCWYCNNELTSSDSLEHFGICNKCYDEMFKSADTIICSLTNKIVELQKQLEASETQNKRVLEKLELITKSNQELEKQLEEKEKIIQMQQNIKRYDIGDILSENIKLKQQLHSQPAEIVEKIKDLAGDYWEEDNNKLIMNDNDFTEILDTVLKEYQ